MKGGFAVGCWLLAVGFSLPRSGLSLDTRRVLLDRLEGPLDLLVGQLVGLELPRQISVVGGQVDDPVAAPVEENDLLLAFFPGAPCLVHDGGNGVVRLRGGNEPLGTGPENASLEGFDLVVGPGLDKFLVDRWLTIGAIPW